MDIQASYDDWSATYDTDANLTRDLDQAVTRELLSEFHFSSIFEIGCGTGKNTSLLAQIGDGVIAVDLSPGMLEKARKKVTSERVAFCRADITGHWPFDDLQAGLVCINLVLEHVGNLSHVFCEAHRLLEEGGRLFICELHPFRQYGGRRARYLTGEGLVEVRAFVHHISDFLEYAEKSGFSLDKLQEWWHTADEHRLPRLVSFMFRK